MASLLILVSLSLSFLTCDGRLLSVDHNLDSKNLQSTSLRGSIKGVENQVRGTGATVLPETRRLLAAEEPRSERKRPGPAAGEGAMGKTKDGDSTVGMAEDLEASQGGVDGARGAGVVQTESLGCADTGSPSHVALLEPAKFKARWGSGERARSLLGHEWGDEEETMLPNQAQGVADALAMDYSKAGGSSPIHNR